MLVDKLEQIKALFREMEQALIAYSGGVDSTLVAKIAYDVLGESALAVTAVSPSLLPEELEEAKIQAATIGIRHQVVETHEMNNPNYTANPINRCYFCKSELHDTLKPLARELGYLYVIDGVNADDLHDYRPGIQAAKERGAFSPLAEVGMTKMEVRQLSQQLGLSWWDKPAQPCFPTVKKLLLPSYKGLVGLKFFCVNRDGIICEYVLKGTQQRLNYHQRKLKISLLITI
jgi:uncharacterized protein